MHVLSHRFGDPFYEILFMKHYVYSKCQDLYLVLLKIGSEAVIYHKVQVIDKNDVLAKAGESHSPEPRLAGSFPQVAVLSGSQL